MQWNSSQRIADEFFAITKAIYEDDGNYIPENEAFIRWLFSGEHSYFENKEAYLNCEKGAFRIAAFFDNNLLIEGKKVAFIGFFEAADNLEKVSLAFNDAETWARSKGAQVVYGPINFNTFFPYRLRVNLKAGDGCFWGEPYNPAYYEKLWEGCGFHVAKRYMSLEIPHEEVDVHFGDYFRALKEKHHQEDFFQKGLSLRVLTPELWLGNLDHLYGLASEIFRENFGYVPISQKLFRLLYGEAMVRKLCPHTSQSVIDENGKIMAFFLSFPDYAPLLCQGNQSKLTASDISFTSHYPLLKPARYLAKTAGVHPDLRGQGVYNKMATAASYAALEHYQAYVACMMREDNPSMRYVQGIAKKEYTYVLMAKNL